MVLWYTDKIENKELGYCLYLDSEEDKEYWLQNEELYLSEGAGEVKLTLLEETTSVLTKRIKPPINTKDITDNNYNGLVVTGFSHKKNKKVYWSVVCSCGKKRKPMRKDSLEKHTGSCTCDRSEEGYKDYTGKRFNKLKVLSLDRTVDGRSYWNVRCNCGKEYVSRSDSMTRNEDGCGSHIKPYELQGDMVKVDVSTELHPKTFTYVDKDIHEKYMKYSGWWTIESKSGVKYVQGTWDKDQVLLHHLVLPLSDDLVIDHIDGNGLNNVRSNLRLVNRQDNSKNISKPVNNTSGYMGVSCLPNGKFRAYITTQDKQIGLGTYEDMLDAVKARKDAEKEYGFHENHGRDKLTK